MVDESLDCASGGAFDEPVAELDEFGASPVGGRPLLVEDDDMPADDVCDIVLCCGVL